MDTRLLNYLVVVYFSLKLVVVEGEEIPFSYENNRVVKLLAMRTSPLPPPISPDSWNVSMNISEFKNIISEVKELKMVIAQRSQKPQPEKSLKWGPGVHKKWIKQMNELREIAEKCVSSIKRRNEYKAQRHWDQIMQTLDTNEPESSNILRRITVEAYDGFRENILPIVHFVNYTKDFSGLSVLLEEMREYGHLYAGTEVFLFARLIRTHCGTNSLLYKELPHGIQFIDSYSVRLLNENNNGALFYKPKEYCRGRHCTSDEAFTFHMDIDDLSEEEALKATWTFEPTNMTEFSDNIKFYLRNEFGNRSYLYSSYYTSLSQTQKSIVIVHLVNNTEDAVRIRVEESHLIKRLIMGGQNTGSNTVGLSIMYTEDRFEKANDGNWVVQPIEMVRNEELNTTINDSSYKCEFQQLHHEFYN